MINPAEFEQKLQQAITDEKITLPTLPEVALRIRDAVDSENSSANEIADLVATDAALSARLLQVANSPLYRGREPIESIQTAITRLGITLVRSLVISLAMKQIFQATSDVLDNRLRAAWQNSVQVAAISRVLSQVLPHLDPNQAMLAGLIHNIGTLPILMFSESYPELLEDEGQLDQLVESLSPGISSQILENWNFPEPLIHVARHNQELDYDAGPSADYVDVVLVARLQTLDPELSEHENWGDIPSFRKVGLEPEVEVISIEGAAEEIQGVEEIFL
ncbi:MAG: HDOD domain-containing protein [Candidatus Sedimenticola sp. 20ELBAFRAG]